MSYSPQVKNVRYKPFCIFSVNSVVINSIYELNLNSSNLFEYDLNNFNLDDKRVNSLNAQIGLLFDGFRISYEMMNPFKSMPAIIISSLCRFIDTQRMTYIYCY